MKNNYLKFNAEDENSIFLCSDLHPIKKIADKIFIFSEDNEGNPNLNRKYATIQYMSIMYKTEKEKLQIIIDKLKVDYVHIQSVTFYSISDYLLKSKK
ncbi:hypothetical protein [Cellulophaga baltica]|uniref:hypothetical protein n=1 Tax=Cellulophaga baltica TaxID=76594 RepID=UPI002494B838|nr:hypothetical protein [Cellulophaga baltica]